MNKAYSYIRFSSAEQAKGRSQVRQIEACEKYCHDNNLHLATGEEYMFLDAGLSGYHGEHLGEKGQLTRFIKLVEDGTIPAGSTLIVESLDRLSRQDVNTALGYFLRILGRGIRVVTLSDGKTYTNKGENFDLIISILIMARANEESSTKSKRIRDAMKAKHEKAREQGLPMGKAIPLWLELGDDGKFKIREDRAAVVQRVFQMAIDGYGKAVTAKMLNAEGVPSFKNKAWGTSSIDKILNNRAVLGEYQPYSVQVMAEGKRLPSGDPILNYFPAIVDDSTYYQAQAAVSGRKVAGTTKQSERFNVWQGVAKCVYCHAAMHLVNKGKPPKGNTYLQCANARKGLCKGKVVRLDHSEVVFKDILAKLDSLSLVQDSSGKISKELAEVEGRLAGKKDKLAQYTVLLAENPTATINKLVGTTEDEIKALEKQREDLMAALAAETVGNREDFFKKLDLVTPVGRSKANMLLKRLKVLVYIGTGYLVTEKDEARFVLAYKDGEIGFGYIDADGYKYDGGGEMPMQGLLGRMERKTPFTIRMKAYQAEKELRPIKPATKRVA